MAAPVHVLYSYSGEHITPMTRVDRDLCGAAESDEFSARLGGRKRMAVGSEAGETYLGHQS